MKPKNHYLMHSPSQLQRDGFIMGAFVGKRKHQIIKMHATKIQNTTTYERSVLLHVLAHQFSDMAMPGFLQDGLVNRSEYTELASILAARSCGISRCLRWKGAMISAGDCLASSGHVYSIKAAVDIDGEIGCIAAQWQRVGEVTSKAVRWRLSANNVMLKLAAHNFTFVQTWYLEGNGDMVCLA